jgi:hypothetical protein
MNPTRTTTRVLALAALMLMPIPAHAFDLTGTWIGKWSCKGFDGSKFTSGNKTSTFRVTQVGNVINADLDNGEYRYNGAALTNTAKPDLGEAVFISCGTDNVPQVGGEAEILRAAVKTKAGTFKASFKGLSIFESDFKDVGTCKYTFKRRDTINPNVDGCAS